MKPIRSEDDFKRWVVRTLDQLGHVQLHTFSNYPDIPDVSAAVNGIDMWLELKYGQFDMAKGDEGREYDEFGFKEVTRGQLDWLIKRSRAGRAQCGILGYLDIL